VPIVTITRSQGICKEHFFWLSLTDYRGRFYTGMFTNAGFPVSADGTMSGALLDSLVVSGDEAAISDRLTDLLAIGLDELLVMPVPVADPAGEPYKLARMIGQL
jgi:hypothetical protein